MENFKEVLKKRIRMLTFLAIIFTILVFTLGVWGYKNSLGNDNHVVSSLYGLSAGAFGGSLAVILKTIFKYNSVIKDENRLKLKYIEENDEREILIRSKMGTTIEYIVFGSVLLGAIVSTYINSTVALTLYSVIIFMVVMKIITKLYYGSKF